ncbi:MAG: hypothetical protein O2960_18670 [Verrucomicrobia bacterium]|nr:hypothetical protein [Verrucomicrobiota bacterium]
MHPTKIQARRANLDDLPGLRDLWRNAKISELSVEKRFTEFQIVEEIGGTIIACAALEISGRQGKIHSWIPPNSEIHKHAEHLLWMRISALAQNHGLVRLWTLETGEFWKSHSFSGPNSTMRRNLPSPFGLDSRDWLFLQLRDDTAETMSVEQHLELFQETQRRVSEKMLSRIRVARLFAGTAATVVLFALVWLAWKMLNHMAIPVPTSKPRSVKSGMQ